MRDESVYHVWRRSDGFLGMTKGKNPPRGWRTETIGQVSFEVLASTSDWEEAKEVLDKAREGKQPAA